MPVNANYLCSLGSAWLSPDSPYWRLESEVSLAVASSLEGGVPRREELSRAYAALLSDEIGSTKAKVPVQSFYEPWTLDPEVKLVFARMRGLRRGDASLHMEHVLSTFGMELPVELKLDADHLAVILNVAGVIAESFPDELGGFATDHLTWLGDYAHEASEAWGDEPGADFYRALLQETIRVAELIEPGIAYRELHGTKSVEMALAG